MTHSHDGCDCFDDTGTCLFPCRPDQKDCYCIIELPSDFDHLKPTPACTPTTEGNT